MQARKIIEEKLSHVVEKISGQKIPVDLAISDKSENGDYYTNIAMRLAGVLKQKPQEIAYKIKKEFEHLTVSEIEKIEVAGPGFINFFLSESYLIETAAYVNKKKDVFGASENLKDKKIMIEFTDPNPFKEFHIGHLYSNIVGESLCRLFESQAARVRRVCYQGDVGLHVAKAIYGMQKLKDQMPDKNSPLSIRAQFMGQAYALGAKAYEENAEAKEEIHDLNKKVYENDSSIQDLYKNGRSWSLEYFESLYKRLGTKFESYYFESETGPIGLKLVQEFLKKDVFELSDGAVIFPGKKYGLHNRVFINSQGLPTYEAKDLGLAPTKYKDFAYDKSIIITAQEQANYFEVVLKALSFINPELAEKTQHISHGMVRLPGGKMSSRTGNVITGEWLMEEAVSRIHKEYPEMEAETAEKVGLAAIKFALLKSTVGRDVEFDFEESISLSGASGPYLQYAYVRTQSILKKNKETGMKNKNSENETLNDEEKALLRQLVYFPEIVTEAQNNLAPNLIATYLFDLSQKFNLFYQKHKVAGNPFRLELTGAVGIVLKNGLNLLGIETVAKM